MKNPEPERRRVAADSFLRWHWDRITDAALRLLLSHPHRAGIRSIIDFGCGDGWQAREIARRIGASTIIGIDIDEARLREAACSGLRAIRANLGERAPVKEGAFDLAIEYAVTEWIPDFPKFVEEMLRSVQPGGYVLLQYGIPGSLGESWARETRRLGYQVRFPVRSMEDFSAALKTVTIPFRILNQEPIWHLYLEGGWRARIERISFGRWNLVDRMARLAGFPPVGVFALLERTP